MAPAVHDWTPSLSMDALAGLDSPAVRQRVTRSRQAVQIHDDLNEPGFRAAGRFPDALLARAQWLADREVLSIATIQQLEAGGVPPDIVDLLRALVRDGLEEYTVVVAYLHRVIEEGEFRGMHVNTRRGIERAWKRVLRADPRAQETADHIAFAVPSTQAAS